MLSLDADAEAARQGALKRKVRTYNALRRGMHAGVSDDVLAQDSIDWARKVEADASSSGSGRTPSPPPKRARAPTAESGAESGDDEPTITYTDEFGRSRTQRQSLVPRSVLAVVAQRAPELDVDEETEVHYGPSTSYPVYDPGHEEAERRRLARHKASLPVQQAHFDSRAELRNRGAGFYQFSHAESEREAERQALVSERERTLQERAVRGTGSVSPSIVAPQAGDAAEDDPFARVERRGRPASPPASYADKRAARKAKIAARRAELAGKLTPSSITAQLDNDRVEAARQDAKLNAFLSDILGSERPPG